MPKSVMTNIDYANLARAAEWELLKSLSGKTICITGALSMSRDDLERFIRALGGQMTESVNNFTDYLVCADSSKMSSKLKEATVRGVPVLTEEEFCGMIMPTVEELLGGSNAGTGSV